MTPVFFTAVLLPFLTALLATAIATLLSIPAMKRLGLIDDPKRHIHPGIIHTKPIPRGGGLPLLLGCLVAGIFFLPSNTITNGLIIACFLALVIGLTDDKLNAHAKDVSPYLRFIINIITAAIVVAGGVSIHFITAPSGGLIHFDTLKILSIPISDILSIIWLIWVMNMINWSKGVDGQMPGIVAIAAIVIGILSLRLNPAGTLIDAKLSFIIAGSSVGFLLFNFYPAKIFPGYSATALYLLLGVVSILSSAKLATAILVLGVPTVDAIFTIIRRIVNKHSPFLHDNKHLHHLLLRLGYSQRQIALFYWGISAILGTISLTISSRSKIFAMIMVGVITVGTLLLLHIVTRNANEKITS